MVVPPSGEITVHKIAAVGKCPTDELLVYLQMSPM